MNTLVKTLFNVDAAKSFVTSVRSNDPYFIFTSNPGPEWTTIPKPLDSKKQEQILYDNMLFGKRISTDDVQLCAKRIDWQFGKIFDMYDDQLDLSDKNYYVVTQDGVDLNVFKCLFNNNGSPSLSEPTNTSLQPFQTMEDGYVWKYMFTIDSFFASKFANSTKIPIIPNQEVMDSAIRGSIDVIQIESTGSSYNNYTVGSFGSRQNIRVNGNSLQYELDGNASLVNNFYKNCLIRIVSNSVTNGQTKLIVGYEVIDGRRIVTLESPFELTPLSTDQYEIYPNVFVSDTAEGEETSCVARAIISPSGANSISSVEILNSGSGYRNAVAELRVDNSVGVTNQAKLRVLMPPEGGHGSDPFSELNSYFVGISSSFSGNTEPFIAENIFQSYGLIKRPLFANCELQINTDTLQGSFIEGETIFRYRPIKLSDVVNVYANGTVIGSNSEFTQSLRNNDTILVQNSDDHLFANVSVISDTELKLNTSPTSEMLSSDVYLTPKEEFAQCVEVLESSLILTNVRPVGLGISQNIFGATSQAFTKTETGTDYIVSSGRSIAEFDTFNQITKLEGIRTTVEEFIPNERIVQVQSDGTIASAIVHSYVKGESSQLDSLYITNEINTISIGLLSSDRNEVQQANFDVAQKSPGELVRDSGKILYVENTNPITRRPEQVEQIKLYLEF